MHPTWLIGAFFNWVQLLLVTRTNVLEKNCLTTRFTLGYIKNSAQIRKNCAIYPVVGRNLHEKLTEQTQIPRNFSWVTKSIYTLFNCSTRFGVGQPAVVVSRSRQAGDADRYAAQTSQPSPDSVSSVE